MQDLTYLGQKTGSGTFTGNPNKTVGETLHDLTGYSNGLVRGAGDIQSGSNQSYSKGTAAITPQSFGSGSINVDGAYRAPVNQSYSNGGLNTSVHNSMPSAVKPTTAYPGIEPSSGDSRTGAFSSAQKYGNSGSALSEDAAAGFKKLDADLANPSNSVLDNIGLRAKQAAATVGGLAAFGGRSAVANASNWLTEPGNAPKGHYDMVTGEYQQPPSNAKPITDKFTIGQVQDQMLKKQAATNSSANNAGVTTGPNADKNQLVQPQQQQPQQGLVQQQAPQLQQQQPYYGGNHPDAGLLGLLKQIISHHEGAMNGVHSNGYMSAHAGALGSAIGAAQGIYGNDASGETQRYNSDNTAAASRYGHDATERANNYNTDATSAYQDYRTRVNGAIGAGNVQNGMVRNQQQALADEETRRNHQTDHAIRLTDQGLSTYAPKDYAGRSKYYAMAGSTALAPEQRANPGTMSSFYAGAQKLSGLMDQRDGNWNPWEHGSDLGYSVPMPGMSEDGTRTPGMMYNGKFIPGNGTLEDQFEAELNRNRSLANGQ